VKKLREELDAQEKFPESKRATDDADSQIVMLQEEVETFSRLRLCSLLMSIGPETQESQSGGGGRGSRAPCSCTLYSCGDDEQVASQLSEIVQLRAKNSETESAISTRLQELQYCYLLHSLQ
jgi:hypothetical protein